MKLFLTLHQILQAIGKNIAHLMVAVLAIALFAIPAICAALASLYVALTINSLIDGNAGTILITWLGAFALIATYVLPSFQSEANSAAMTILNSKSWDEADWFERRRQQKLFEAAKNWRGNLRTYRVIFSDGVSQDHEMFPTEIERWATESNKLDVPYRITRILDLNGKVVWQGQEKGSRSLTLSD
jgi:hypothetical protein